MRQNGNAGLSSAAQVSSIDGADAPRRAIGAADYHPPAVRRFAPAIQRMQRTGSTASKLAHRPPLIRGPFMCTWGCFFSIQSTLEKARVFYNGNPKEKSRLGP